MNKCFTHNLKADIKPICIFEVFYMSAHLQK